MGNSVERDNAALLDAWRNGDADAGDELLRRHFVDVYRFFCGHLSGAGRGEDAEDLTQKTFEACIAGRDRVRGDFRAYLFGVARHQLWLEWERRRNRGDVLTPSEANARDLRTSPSGRVARLDDHQRIAEAIERLPLEFQAVLRRFYWEEQPIALIAEELGVALGTVKSRLHRGKALLRAELETTDAPPALVSWLERRFVGGTRRAGGP